MARNPECEGLRGGSGGSGALGVPARGAEDGTARPGVEAASLVHDVNNLLTVVLGSLEQLRRQRLDDRGQVQLDRAHWGARQAGLLARQLLAAARGEVRPEVVDLNKAVGAFGAMMGGVAGDGVGLAVELAPAALPVRLDPGQLESRAAQPRAQRGGRDAGRRHGGHPHGGAADGRLGRSAHRRGRRVGHGHGHGARHRWAGIQMRSSRPRDGKAPAWACGRCSGSRPRLGANSTSRRRSGGALPFG